MMNLQIGLRMPVSDTLGTYQSIPVNLLRQWHFCPRIPYYQELLRTHIVRPPWVEQGNRYETAQRKLFQRRNLSRFGLERGVLHHQVSLSHADEPFHGIADLLIETSQAIHVVEVKLNLRNLGAGIIAQLIALSILAEKQFDKPAADAFVLYGSRSQVKHLHIDANLKEQTRQVAHRILDTLTSGIKPDSPASAHQCAQCEYLNYCNDR